MKEHQMLSRNGISVLLIILAIGVAAAYYLYTGARTQSAFLALGAGVVLALDAFSLAGLYMVEPNQAAVLSLFGKYVGTVKDQGLRWNNPFYGKKKISLRTRNFESSKLKVNDLDGSPIEIASVVVWNVVDLDPERRAAMVSNLLVVLCGERGTQPIVNTGSIY